MTVDEFVDAEKKRLTVFARYMRQMGKGKDGYTEGWRSSFWAHCNKHMAHNKDGSLRADSSMIDEMVRTDEDHAKMYGCANVGDKP